jgi:hypothetical protein
VRQSYPVLEIWRPSDRLGLALYGVGLGLALVANIAGHVMRERVFLWMGVVGVVALAIGLVLDLVAQRRRSRPPDAE